MPARLGPIRFFPGSSIWQIPQVFRNSRAPSSSALTPAPKQLSARVRDSASTAAEKNLPISPPNWVATPQRTVKDVLSCIRTDRRLEPSIQASRRKFKAVLCGPDLHTFLPGGSQSYNPSGAKPLKLP